MNIFLLAQTDGSVGNRLFGSADSFLENRTEGSAKPIIRSDTIQTEANVQFFKLKLMTKIEFNFSNFFTFNFDYSLPQKFK